ncbi:MAG: C69 family dipeptidase [Bacteroidales bacterium]|jgi:dipeptidase|nr:C69 family dipeptidase [Bacteroidales bacterium]
MKNIILWLCILFPLCGNAQEFNCYTLIAGCKATVDGSVMMAHNEDDGGEQMLNWYRIPALQHSPDQYLLFRNGGREQLPSQTNGYLWLELPKMEVSDGYLNDKGVAIVSDGCPSKETRKDFTDGGVVYEVREMVARLAVSARHAVEIIGRLVETYGYADSGRSYCVADSKEAWVVAVVQGRHWVAQRIPDNHVMALPNSYTIDQIDLSDTQNFAGSADIITYATERGWYNAADGAFSFRKAYAAKGSYDHVDNILRAWLPVCSLSGRDYPKTAEDLPFSFQPAKQVSLQTMMDMLSSHYHPEPLKAGKSDALHGTRGSICHNDTQYGAVFQLRGNMPVEIGAVAWIAPYNPCMQVFTPWYIGMNKVPAAYSRYAGYVEALANHFVDKQGFKEKYPDKAYWKYSEVSQHIRADYGTRILKIKPERERFQQKLLEQQSSFEKRMTKLYKKDKDRCGNELSAYTAEWLQKTMFKL